MPFTVRFDQKQTNVQSCREQPAFSGRMKQMSPFDRLGYKWQVQMDRLIPVWESDVCSASESQCSSTWSGGVSCQITIISPIWRNETHKKEVYGLDWKGSSEARGTDEKEIPCYALGGVACILFFFQQLHWCPREHRKTFFIAIFKGIFIYEWYMVST